MAISSQQVGATRLREVINSFLTERNHDLDRWALEMLVRLKRCDDAGRAFAALKLNEGEQETQFLWVCVLVEQLARRFREIIKAEQEMSKRLLRLGKAVADLRSFVEEQTTDPPASDLLSMPMRFRRHDLNEAMPRGLELISALIKWRQPVSNEIVKKLGATRDKYYKNAAIVSAVQLFAIVVRQLSGRAHKKEIRELAPVILGRTLPDESVSYALREPQAAKTVFGLITLSERRSHAVGPELRAYSPTLDLLLPS